MSNFLARWVFPSAALALTLTLPRCGHAAPLPLQPGWTVTLVADSLYSAFAMAADPASGDAFVLGVQPAGPLQIERIHPDGSRSPFAVPTTAFVPGFLFFDPEVQRLYLSGAAGTTVFDAGGGAIGYDPVPSGGVARGADHRLYEATLTSGMSAGVGPVQIDVIDEASFAHQLACTTGAIMDLSEDAALVADPAGGFYLGNGSSWSPLPCGGFSLGGAIGGAGRTAYLDHQLYRATGLGVWVQPTSSGAPITPFASGFAATVDIGAGPGGSLYVLDWRVPSDPYSGRIWRFSLAPTPARAVSWGALKSEYR